MTSDKDKVFLTSDKDKVFLTSDKDKVFLIFSFFFLDFFIRKNTKNTKNKKKHTQKQFGPSLFLNPDKKSKEKNSKEKNNKEKNTGTKRNLKH